MTETNLGMPQPVLELVGISKRFGGVTALSSVDFTLLPGEVHGLVGENGAGKSTLMKIIAGVHHEFEGEMRLDGKPVRFRNSRDARDAGIGMVHQELSVIPDLSVAENVFLGRQLTGATGLVQWGRMEAEAKTQLAQLGIDVDPRTRAGSLPLGLQQLVELGRVLFSGARIVILDEPTSALSPPEVERLFQVLATLRAQGRSFIFISHFLDDILKVSDRITIFRNSRKVRTVAAAAVDKNDLIEDMIGRGHDGLEDSYLHAIRISSPEGAPVVLEARGLCLDGALDGIDLKVRAGEVLGIYGFMGCGQLELARALAGKLRPSSGSLVIDGRSLRMSNTAAAKRAGIALVPESRRSMLFSDVPVYKNISISFLERLSWLWLKPAEERRIGQKLVDDLRIRPYSADPPVRTLSGGNQQKVALARWLTHLPRVLILAEPTRGMDVGAKDDVVKIIKDLKARGVGIVVVSTEPETILGMADRIMVMRRGRITAELADMDVGKEQLLAAA